MGEQDVTKVENENALRQFSRQLIRDMRALERMLRDGLIETGVRRIGAEQELFLVDRWGHPAPIIEDVLARNSDPRVVPELTQFNLELNLAPSEFGGDCLRRLEQQLTDAREERPCLPVFCRPFTSPT